MNMWRLLNPDLLKQVQQSSQKSKTQQGKDKKGAWHLADWLILPKRLTKTLKQNLSSAYEFHLLDQTWRDLSPEESEFLGTAGRAWVRSVSHQMGEKVLVEAFSIIPEKTFQALSENLESLEARPIGDALLYDNPQVTRSPFYFQKAGEYWQRASLFFYEQDEKKYPLMVMERFVNPESLPRYVPLTVDPLERTLNHDPSRLWKSDTFVSSPLEGEGRVGGAREDLKVDPSFALKDALSYDPSLPPGETNFSKRSEGKIREGNLNKPSTILGSPSGSPSLILSGFQSSKSVSPSRGETNQVTAQLTSYLKLIRLHKPLPILLCLWPTLWGLWLASGGFPGIKLLLIFVLGAFFMRSAGCVFNDIADRNFDKYVARTKDRPLARGEVSVFGAVILGVVLSLVAFGLVCLTNTFTIALSFVALGLAVLYPLMKRWIPFPQVFLGLAFNFGLIMAFAAVKNQIPSVAWLWFLSAILWTVMYDTYYALADKQDDEKIGIGSTAIFFGKHVIGWMRGLQLAVFILWGIFFLSGIGVRSPMNEDAVLKLGVIFLLLFLSFYRQNQFARDKYYLQAFLDNHWVGFLVFMGIFISS